MFGGRKGNKTVRCHSAIQPEKLARPASAGCAVSSARARSHAPWCVHASPTSRDQRFQVVFRSIGAGLRQGGHGHRRPQWLRQEQRGRCHHLGDGRAEREKPAGRSHGRRDLQWQRCPQTDRRGRSQAPVQRCGEERHRAGFSRGGAALWRKRQRPCEWKRPRHGNGNGNGTGNGNGVVHHAYSPELAAPGLAATPHRERRRADPIRRSRCRSDASAVSLW